MLNLGLPREGPLAALCSLRIRPVFAASHASRAALLGATHARSAGKQPLSAWLDCGMFLQGVMTAARARGLDTCPQAAFVPFHRIVTEHLGIPANEQLVCGMSLGHADPDAIENRLVTERAPVAEFTRFFA
ncbi:hypothetical protein CFB82_17025 [Burkholderia sp. HI2714]|nr:hypothetical protein CFB82_17025 [Burkholderia sp. HI2714]